MFLNNITRIVPAEYLFFMLALLLCAIISFIASRRVVSAYGKYNRVPTRTGITGHEATRRLMYAFGIHDIAIGQVRGTLSDHYHPRKKVVNLSESTFNSASIAAVAVAAHEMGHVLQKKNGDLFYRLRTLLVPVVNFGSRLAMPLVLVGLLLDYYSLATDPELGYKLAMLGVVLYGGSFLFALVTLPVELNASSRAIKILVDTGILYEDELPGAKRVLSAAAMTYMASLLTSLVYFLRFLFQVLMMFGRRDRR